MKQTKYDKLDESDGQMVIRIAKKFVVIFVILFMFDFLLDLFSTLLDFFIEFLHIIIDFFEYSLELLLEHFLNSNHYESDVIIVNFVLLIATYAFFCLCLIMPRLYRWLRRRIKAIWLKRKRKNSVYWKSLALIRKVEIIATYCVGTLIILFFVTLS